AKFKLFERSDHSIINVDNNYGYNVIRDLEKLNKEAITYPINEKSDYKATEVIFEGQDTIFTVNGIRYEFVLPGEYNVHNALGCIAAAKILGVSDEDIKSGLLDVVVPGRCERVGNKYNLPYELIIDFAHTPDGLKNLLETLRGLTKNRLIAVYGSGGDRDKVKRAEMGRIGSEIADLVIITSDNPRTEDPIAILKEISCDIQKTNYLAIEDRVEAIRLAMDMAEPGDVVVLAGKGHETYQIMPEGKVHFDEREVIADILNK
ncbi:UDP-N-acetylmuramoyl-L-alanyl-D-glutamate--2,6-diaminopimelate ligase, partial [Clostridium saudiense]|nr:UDP-N-acetylmuramoyl-L-alanyl-D-glutamate--2,6-diaminopimelate ligase [Clostridium saudiense]